jgi:2-dehydropantoate 2-reductase
MAKVGIVGAGAVGGYYGARLAAAGHDVWFVMRRDLGAVRQNGLRVYSKDGDFTLPQVNAVATSAEIGECDWVICSLKATALNAMEPLVRPLVGAETRVLALMNGLGIEQQFAECFGGERVFGGMAFVCINRGEPGVIHHLDYGRVTVGHFDDDAAETARLEALLTSGSIETAAAPNLLFARWEKLCWNVPFSGLSVAAGGVGTATILADEGLSAIARETIHDVVRAANEDLAERGFKEGLDAAEMEARMFAQTATMGDYQPSMVIDYLQGNPLECEAILGAPVRRAAELGVGVPAMEHVYQMVRFADRRVRGEARLLTRADLRLGGAE